MVIIKSEENTMLMEHYTNINRDKYNEEDEKEVQE